MKNLKNALLLKQLYQRKQLGYAYTSITSFKEVAPELTLPSTLSSLKKQAQECHLCELSKSRKNVIFGEGNSHADIMFIGDAPNNSDDSIAKIFTGRAGELLSKMITNVLGLSREEVYISNLLKCHTLDSHNPSASHTHTCYPYILKEIALVQPKIIVTLGTLAYEYLSHEDSPLEEVHGIVHQKEKYILIPTFHPNYLLKNPSKKKAVFEDLKKVKKLYDSLL
ncbi:MAG: uracil-DNA glycosylase [Sulfurovum sp.]|nr:uracil-DNA glycosylase [Sulfurovum sp.]